MSQCHLARGIHQAKFQDLNKIQMRHLLSETFLTIKVWTNIHLKKKQNLLNLIKKIVLNMFIMILIFYMKIVLKKKIYGHILTHIIKMD